MKRVIGALLFCISFFPLLSFADTYAAVPGFSNIVGKWGASAGVGGMSALDACRSNSVSLIAGPECATSTRDGLQYFNDLEQCKQCGPSPSGTGGGYVYRKYFCPYGGTRTSDNQCINAPTCPSGQERVNGQCVATCTAPLVRNESGVCACSNPAQTLQDGVCKTNCSAGYHVGVPDNGQCIQDCTGRQTQGADGQCKCQPSGGVISAPRAALDSACVGGCSIKWNVGLRSLDNTTVYGYVSFNGSTCTGPTTLIPANVAFVPKDTSGKAADGVTPDPINVPENNQSPEACDAVGGSWGVYNGASKCLSSKDVNSMDKLTVTKTSSTTVNPDGTSTVKTDTTYKTTDATSGQTSTSTSTSTVNKDASGNVIGAGSGTTTGTGPDPSSASDLCKNNPGLDICNNRLNKEETQVQVKDYLKQLTDPGTTPYTVLENAKHSEQSQADLQTELDKFTAAGTGQFVPDAASKSSWESAMSSGWLEPVSRAGCQPYSATISGRTWNLDICPTAEKIASISEYVIWFFLAVGVFVMFTGGAFTKGS